MLCIKPISMGLATYGCGQCIPCRINKRREWQSRLILESYTNVSSYFVTLTYSPENLPSNNSLHPKTTQDFIKRLRKNTSLSLRYYLVGEYGDLSFRPHYHLALYNSSYTLIDIPTAVQNAWQLGHTHTGDLNSQSASYLCGYVVKKMTKKSDPRLGGKYPEFSRQSNRPGIGAYAMDKISASLDKAGKLSWDNIQKLVINGKEYATPRYLKNRVKKEYFDGKTPEAYEIARAIHVHEVRENTKKNLRLAPYISAQEYALVVNGSSLDTAKFYLTNQNRKKII